MKTSQYTLNHLKENHGLTPPLSGFLEKHPPKNVLYDDMAHSQWTEMQHPIVKNMPYKPASKKKKCSEYQVIQQLSN